MVIVKVKRGDGEGSETIEDINVPEGQAIEMSASDQSILDLGRRRRRRGYRRGVPVAPGGRRAAARPLIASAAGRGRRRRQPLC